MVLYAFLCPITNSTQLMVPELYFFSHLYFFIFCLIRILTLKSYKISLWGCFFFCYLLIQKNISIWVPENVKMPRCPKGYWNNRNIKVLTSEILQLFPRASEMLISWSPSDHIPDSRTCRFTQRAFRTKPTETTSRNILLARPRDGLGMVLPVSCDTSLEGFSSSPPGAAESGEARTAARRPPCRGGLGRGGRVVLHERDGRQLLAELLQHDHALQQGDVVHTGGKEARASAHCHVRVGFLDIF